MKTYLDLLDYILTSGVDKSNRTGVGSRSVFGYQMRFNLLNGFPLLTTKKLHIKSIIYELLWFLRGETSISYLKKNHITIWNEWAADNEIGPMYGKQWVSWQSVSGKAINQIENAIKTLRTNSNSRRNIVCAWNPSFIPLETQSPQENVKNGKMALAPCHILFQLYCHEKELSMQVYQRSADVFLGLPFNIASYSFLLCMFAQQTGMIAKELVWTGGDVHLYNNHLVQAKKQLARQPRKLPKLIINSQPPSIFSYKYENFEIRDYEPYPEIPAPIAV